MANIDKIVSALRTAANRKEGRKALTGLRGADLRRVADAMNIPFRSRDTNADLRDIIVELAVGRRLDSHAIFPGR